MNARSFTTAVPQPEDYRAMLRWVCISNFCAVILAVALEFAIRGSASLHWPHWGNFSWTYNLVVLEFALVTAGIALMLRRTAWLDSAPRAALARLRYLLMAVLTLDGLHFLGLFMTTGGIHGPMMVLLPVVVITTYLLLPHRDAHRVAGVFLLLLLAALIGAGDGGAKGMLSEAFRAPDGWTLPGMVVAAIGLLAALLIGATASGQMERVGISLQRRVSYDPQTGLFTRELLERRVPGELKRIRRSKPANATLLMISFKNIQNLLPHGDYASYDAMLREFARVLRSVTRATEDTCARYDVATFAVLLPTVSAGTAELVAERIQQTANAIRSGAVDAARLELAFGVASTTSASAIESAAFVDAAEQALQEARVAGEGHQLVLREL